MRLMLAIWGVWGAAAYDPSPVYEVFGAGEQSVNGFYVLLRRGEGGDSAVFARAYEKRASADAWLLAPSQLEWRRLNSGSASWAIKQQRFAPRCFRPAASYNDSCGRCCTLPGEVPVYSARGSAPAPAAEAAAAAGGATDRHGAWPVPPRAGWSVVGRDGVSAGSDAALLPAPSVRQLPMAAAATHAATHAATDAAPAGRGLTMAPLAECLHRVTVLMSRRHEAEASALLAECATDADALPLELGGGEGEEEGEEEEERRGGGTTAAAVAGAAAQSNATRAFRAQLLLSQAAQGLRRDGSALGHALRAVELACGGLRAERGADGARLAPSWPCSVGLFETAFLHTKLGNTSAAAAAYLRAIDWNPAGAAAATAAAAAAAAAATAAAAAPQPQAQQRCSVLHNGTVLCEPVLAARAEAAGAEAAATPPPQADDISAVRDGRYAPAALQQAGLMEALRHSLRSPFDWRRGRGASLAALRALAPRFEDLSWRPADAADEAAAVAAAAPPLLGQGDPRGPPPAETPLRHLLANFVLGAPWSLFKTSTDDAAVDLAAELGVEAPRLGAGALPASGAAPPLTPPLTLVVSHYNEDLSWLGALRSFDRVFIYTKAPGATSEAALRALVPERLRGAAAVQVAVQVAGEAPAPGDGCSGGSRGAPGAPTVCVRRLPNVGREGHTFLHHVASEYDGDVGAAVGTAFVQGEPQPHFRFAHLDGIVQACLAADRAEARSNATTSLSYCALGTEVSLSTREGYPHVPPVLPLGALFDRLFHNRAAARGAAAAPPEQLFAFANGGQFLASGAALRVRSRAFVRQLLAGEISAGIDPVEGYLYERLWPILFEAQAGLGAGSGAPPLFAERTIATRASEGASVADTGDSDFE